MIFGTKADFNHRETIEGYLRDMCCVHTPNPESALTKEVGRFLLYDYIQCVYGFGNFSEGLTLPYRR